MATVICPTCGHPVPTTANFCANCGRPRTALQQELERRARSTGIPYQTLVDQERARAGITVPSAQRLGQIQSQLQRIEGTMHDFDRRLRKIEEHAPETAATPRAPEAPVQAEVAVEPEPLPVPSVVGAPMPVVPEPIPPSVTVPEPLPPEAPVLPRATATEDQIQQEIELLLPLSPQREPKPPREFDLEDLLSGRVLAWTGGLAILIGAAFFLSLAFSRGWIGPTARVVIGISAATVMLMTGAWFFERRERIFGHVMVATGLGVMNMSLFAAIRLYDLISVPTGLLAVLTSAIVAAAIAIRANSQIVAGYGLIAALIAPPLLGSEPDLPTALFVITVLIGTTTISLFRSWRWLPPLAFFLSFPQVGDLLISDINAAIALLVLSGFWALNAIAAGGEEFRTPTERISITSATLLMLNAVYLVAMGFVILDGDLEGWRGLFLVGVALGHGAIGGYFLRDRGEYHPFGMLAFGTGVAALSMAIPIQLGGPVVPIGWAAEAAALAWIYGRRKHIYAGAYAIVLGILAIGHLIIFEYPLDQLVREDLQSAWPFLNANGMTLAFLLAALVVSGYFVAVREVRIGLAVVGLSLILYAVPFELSGAPVAMVWATQAVVLAWIYGRRQQFFAGVYAILPGVLAIGHLMLIEYPLDQLQIDRDLHSTWPFLNASGGALIFLLASLAAAGYFVAMRRVRVPLTVIALSLAMYAVPFELSGVAVVGSWAAIFVLAVTLQRWPALAKQPVASFENGLYIPTFAAAVLAVIHIFAFELPLADVHPDMLPDIPFTDERTLTALILIAAATAASFITRHWHFSIGARVAAFAFAAYLMLFELSLAGVVVAWSALAISMILLSRRDPRDMRVYLASSGPLLAGGLLIIFYYVATPARLVVREDIVIDHPPLWSGATAALGAVIAALFIITWLYRERTGAVRWVAALAGALMVYLLSVAVVDEFQSRAGGETSLESLQKQAQVALSILWAVLGGSAFVAGILRFGAPVRIFGLALLALATVKVFIVDLAALDTSYRVLSFIGLGVLLLVSSYVYQHYKGRFEKDHDDSAPPVPTGQRA